MRILFLDDAAERHEAFKEWSKGHDVTHVYTAEQCMVALGTMEPFDLVCLDHDLELEHYGGYVAGGNREDGRLVCKFIAEEHPERGPEFMPSRIHIHSWNIVAAVEMERILADAGWGPDRLTRSTFGPESMRRILGPEIRDLREG